MTSQDEPVRKRARASRGPVVLAALLNGAALEDIANTEQISIRRAEKLLRDELSRRWIAPAHEYARLQIARLETVVKLLKDKVKAGDLPAIDRLLRILDRLDRYHGFSKFAKLASYSREDVLPKLIGRLDQATSNLAETE